MADLNQRVGEFLDLTPEQEIRLKAIKSVVIAGTVNYARTILNSGEISQNMFGATSGFEEYKEIILENLIQSGILKSFFTKNSKTGIPLTEADWGIVNQTVAENTFLIALILDPKSDPESNTALNDMVAEVWKIVHDKIGKKNEDLPKIVLGGKDWGIKAKHFDKKHSKDTRNLLAMVATKICDSIIGSCTNFFIQAEKERKIK